MSSYSRWGALILMLTLVATAPAERRAVLVGVGEYKHLTQLSYCSRDMTALRSQLVAGGFAESQVVLLNDDSPKSELPFRSSILTRLKTALGAAQRQDVVLVAFSGHGVYLNGVAYLCPYDANLENTESLISIHQLWKLLQGCQATTKILIVDACRDEPRRGTRKQTAVLQSFKAWHEAIQEGPPAGIVILTSCSNGEVSLEHDPLQHGVFMNFLLQGLRGEADSEGDRVVTLRELAKYTQRKTWQYARDQLGTSQSPQLSGEFHVDALDIPLGGVGSLRTIRNRFDMELVLIPAGKLRDRPINRSFHLGRHEVTIGQFSRFVRETGYEPQCLTEGGAGYDSELKELTTSARFNWENPGWQVNQSHPVVNVSWRDATAFCDYLSRLEGRTYRLPTEEEWEYACRAGSLSPFAAAQNAEELTQFANLADPCLREVKLNFAVVGANRRDGFAFTAPVGVFAANAYGVHDMLGNVEEWCRSRYGRGYAVRGGSWQDEPIRCRVDSRHGYPEQTTSEALGFRVLME